MRLALVLGAVGAFMGLGILDLMAHNWRVGIAAILPIGHGQPFAADLV